MQHTPKKAKTTREDAKIGARHPAIANFIAFLKKCQSNYQKKITENNRQIKELQKQFDELSEESAEVKSA